MTRGLETTTSRGCKPTNTHRFESAALTTSHPPIYDNTAHVAYENDPQHNINRNWGNGYHSYDDRVHQDEIHTQPSSVPTHDVKAGEAWCNKSTELRTKNIGDHLSELMKSPSLSDAQKLAILTSFPPAALVAVYERHIATKGPLRISASPTFSHAFHGPNEDTYLPLKMYAVSSPDPSAPPPLYPKYVGYFTTSEQARRYRKRARIPPKAHAPDVERVRRFGRK